MSGPITVHDRIRNFVNKEKTEGRHWIQGYHGLVLAYDGSTTFGISGRSLSLPCLYVLFDMRSFIKNIAYHPVSGPPLMLYENSNWNNANLATIPPDMRDIARIRVFDSW
ncbi:hypothetical protein FE392_10065 [Xenorhabdus sp. 12]|uniref:Uncharacterized protein n=1 Tax=Xenorhabdus santafensis TaxID=2582833 RepID=A0ABU4SA54_9GAMM|nr:hypothetical protein [Xenorhabdus sp. 12]MDX7987674.1 hypothetical protein [Xenorhabdus sp. 12]